MGGAVTPLSKGTAKLPEFVTMQYPSGRYCLTAHEGCPYTCRPSYKQAYVFPANHSIDAALHCLAFGPTVVPRATITLFVEFLLISRWLHCIQ